MTRPDSQVRQFAPRYFPKTGNAVAAGSPGHDANPRRSVAQDADGEVLKSVGPGAGVLERWSCAGGDLHYIRNPAPRGQSPPLVLDRNNSLAMNPLRKNRPVGDFASPRPITPKTGTTPKYWDQPVSFPEWGSLLDLEAMESQVRYRHRQATCSRADPKSAPCRTCWDTRKSRPHRTEG